MNLLTSVFMENHFPQEVDNYGDIHVEKRIIQFNVYMLKKSRNLVENSS